MKLKFKIEGLDCANCARELEKELAKIEGIENIVINFMTQKMELDLEENEKNEIIDKINKTIKREEPDVTIKLI